MHIDTALFQKAILAWFEEHGRKHLPWQQHPTPYHVWVSEIMLQQTQVNTVISYFERFIQVFPTVIDLANASLDQVLTLWAGLGYYARGRNLHRSAQLIMTEFKGELPQSLTELMTLPGIGRSTAGAILALGYHKVASILDGNVKRVLTRLHAIEGWPGLPLVEKQLWQLAEYYTPEQQVEKYTQAMMDLGAMICTRTKPKCEVCPISTHCIAQQQNRTKEYPYAKPKKILAIKSCYLLLFRDNKTKKILLEKRPPVGIWGGLWALPQHSLESNISDLTKENYNLKIIKKNKLFETFRHTFSHFHLDISPLVIDVESLQSKKIKEQNNLAWYSLRESLTLGLPKPVKQILEALSL